MRIWLASGRTNTRRSGTWGLPEGKDLFYCSRPLPTAPCLCALLTLSACERRTPGFPARACAHYRCQSHSASAALPCATGDSQAEKSARQAVALVVDRYSTELPRCETPSHFKSMYIRTGGPAYSRCPQLHCPCLPSASLPPCLAARGLAALCLAVPYLSALALPVVR